MVPEPPSPPPPPAASVGFTLVPPRVVPASQPPKARPPWVVITAAIFLGYTSMVALPLICLAKTSVDPFTTLQVALSTVATLALLALRRWRVTFHVVRLALAWWAGRGVLAAVRLVVAPGAVGAADSRLLIQQVLLLMGAGALCLLFYLYSFGRASRRFYGLRAAGQRGMPRHDKTS